MKVDDGGRKGWSIDRGGRREREGAGLRRWAVERGVMGGLGKRHCPPVVVFVVLLSMQDAGFVRRSRRFFFTATIGCRAQLNETSWLNRDIVSDTAQVYATVSQLDGLIK